MIICYGDSNTWGYNPLVVNSRYKVEDIYTTILKNIFMEEGFKRVKVLNRGMPARCASSDVLEPYKDGYTPFKNEFSDYNKEVNLFIIMLGTNDVKLNKTAKEISADIKKLMDIIIDNSKIKNILIISPSPLKKLDYDNLPQGQIPYDLFYNDESHVQTSQDLANELENLCESYQDKVHFLNGANLWETSNQDGIHLEPHSHRKIAQEIYNFCISNSII